MSIHKKIKSYRFGIVAEFIAIIFLSFKGYKILKRRYKSRLGEVDIIACKKGTLIAVEVKARKKNVVHKIGKNNFLIDEVVSFNQRERIKKSIIFFIKSHQKKYFNHKIRFDLIVVSPYKMPLHLIGFWE